MKGQRKNSRDRISALPQDTIEKILTLMPIRDALRTSILSRKWRYCWTTMAKLVFNDRNGNEEIDEHKFVKAIFHVLLLHKAPILEFSLFVNSEIFSEIDQIILHLSRGNNLKKFIFEILGTDTYLLPRSFFSLQGLEYLDLSYCTFELPLMYNGFSRLKTLRFCDVSITIDMLFQFLINCPIVEEFAWLRDYWIDMEITEYEFVELFKCLPSIQVLEFSRLYIKPLAACGMPHKLPISLPHLRILVLGVCFVDLSTVLCVINSCPNLEKIKMEMYWDHNKCLQQTFSNLHDIQDYLGLKLDHLKEMEITSFTNHALEMEFVKLVMANSPVLKKALVELDISVSVDEEVKMLRDLLQIPFPRASPTANFIIKRPKNYYRYRN
ncbi:F-box/FBD/LRR-repeat protein At1g13570-like [Lactuca sativa]|nr:F-box/FBD/LRR-repeat protein At1g13570-like [Lactuca sativa]